MRNRLKLKVSQPNDQTSCGYNDWYINDQGYQVVITGATTATVGREVLFLFSGHYAGGPNHQQSAGWYTEEGHPISFFGWNGYEMHYSLHEPESCESSEPRQSVAS